MHKGVSVVALATLCVVLAMSADDHAKDSVSEEYWVCNVPCAAPAEDILRQQMLDTLGLSVTYTDDNGTLVYVY